MKRISCCRPHTRATTQRDNANTIEHETHAAHRRTQYHHQHVSSTSQTILYDWPFDPFSASMIKPINRIIRVPAYVGMLMLIVLTFFFVRVCMSLVLFQVVVRLVPLTDEQEQGRKQRRPAHRYRLTHAAHPPERSSFHCTRIPYY